MGRPLFGTSSLRFALTQMGFRLLDVSPQKISSWPARIRENLEKLQRHDAESPHHREEEKLMPTGENGAVTTNVDPYLGELT
jgi:hypothetical protein